MKRGLPYELFLGFRYLGSRGNRANLSLFAWIGVCLVAFGLEHQLTRPARVRAVPTPFVDA